MSDYISGTRPGGERKAPTLYSLNSLLSKEDEAADLARLYQKVWSDGANCETDPDKWTGDDLPTDREAQEMCSGCPALKMCREYASRNNPVHGVWGGRVFGREESQ